MYRCKPERNPRQVTLIMLTFVTAFIATAVLRCSISGYNWIFELLLIIVVSLGIMIVYRYSMTEMDYEVANGSFNKRWWGKSAQVCSLSLATAIMLIPRRNTPKRPKQEIPI